jgi:hypothetical protein
MYHVCYGGAVREPTLQGKSIEEVVRRAHPEFFSDN